MRGTTRRHWIGIRERLSATTVHCLVFDLMIGHSPTYTARRSGVNVFTVLRYRYTLREHGELPEFCRCGKTLYHKGTCSWKRQGEKTEPNPDFPIQPVRNEYIKEPRATRSDILAGITSVSSVYIPIARRG